MRSRGLAAFLLLLKETSALQCHQCSINLDATGHKINPINLPLDDSTDNCWSLETEDFVDDCQDGEDVCVLHIDAEWMPDGKQFYKIERACANEREYANARVNGDEFRPQNSLFSEESLHFYKRVCPSVRPSAGPYGTPSLKCVRGGIGLVQPSSHAGSVLETKFPSFHQSSIIISETLPMNPILQ